MLYGVGVGVDKSPDARFRVPLVGSVCQSSFDPIEACSNLRMGLQEDLSLLGDTINVIVVYWALHRASDRTASGRDEAPKNQSER